jgi:hypothetical protein
VSSGGGAVKSGGSRDACDEAETPLDPTVIAGLYKQAATKFNIKQKDCIKFLVEKVSSTESTPPLFNSSQ